MAPRLAFRAIEPIDPVPKTSKQERVYLSGYMGYYEYQGFADLKAKFFSNRYMIQTSGTPGEIVRACFRNKVTSYIQTTNESPSKVESFFRN